MPAKKNDAKKVATMADPNIDHVVAHLESLGHGEAAAEVLDKFGANTAVRTGAWATTPSDYDALAVETRLVQSHAPQPDPYGAANMPLYQTATFAQTSATDFGDFDYTRSGNPTRSALQAAVADAEGCTHCLAFSTGMAALSAVTRLCKAGDEVLLSDDSYGGTYRLLAQVCRDMGIVVKYVAMDGPEGPKRLEAAMTPKVSLVMVESPTNPMQRVCDLRGLSQVCKAHNALLEVDNTLMSPLLQKPLQLGADVVVHSATKFIAGHSDTMCGVVCCDDDALAKRLYFAQNAEGTGLAPFDCWLALRGLKTMALRVDKAQANAVKLANYLHYQQPKVTKVYYATLPDHPDRDLHASQATGGGCVVCFTTGDTNVSKHVVTNTKLFNITVSFGSVHSLISCPCDMSHASIPAEVRASRDFPEDIVRVCVGIEDADDLIADLDAAFKSYKKSWF